MIARVLKPIAWSLLFGFATACCTSVVATIFNQLYGPVFYSTTLVEHVGQALVYGIVGGAMLAAAFLISYLIWFRAQRPAKAILNLAIVALAVQTLELGIVEALAIRESHSLSWPIAEQFMPFNIGLFSPVGLWEGRPDAAFFWFSAALAVVAFAAWSARRGH